MSLHRSLPCAIEAKGIFHQDLKSIKLDFDLEATYTDGKVGRMIVEKENLCDWMTLEQAGRSNCPPQNGPVTIGTELELARGWVKEVDLIMAQNY